MVLMEYSVFIFRPMPNSAKFGSQPNRVSISGAGRFYCYSNRRWVTDSDDNYGSNLHQMNENCGTGTEPIIEWEHMGTLVQPGDVISKLHFSGKSNNNQVSDLEMRIVLKRPSNSSAWETGFDADGEVINEVIFSGNYKTAAMTGDMTDFMKRVIEFDPHVVEHQSMLSIYLRPIGTITGTRYFRATWNFE